MKIVFYPVDCVPFHGKFLEERPFGGTETAVIRLAEALDFLGQEVYVLSELSILPVGKPIYIPVDRAEEIGEFDVLIVIRGIQGLIRPFRCKKRLFWIGDAYDNIHTFGIGDQRLIRRIDLFLPVSNWHAETVCRTSGFPLEKTFVLRNGISTAYFQGVEKKQRKRLMYSSSPLRGLENLPEIFLELKQRHSETELVIFSSSSVYRPEWPPVNVSEGEILAKMRTLPGCHVYSPLPQFQLAREFMKSAIWAYPTNFEETSCITAMEAQAGGAIPVTTALAALPETVGEAGILLEGKAGTKAYCDKFVEACDHLFTEDAPFQKLSQQGRERAQTFDWKFRAQELIQELEKRFGLI